MPLEDSSKLSERNVLFGLVIVLAARTTFAQPQAEAPGKAIVATNAVCPPGQHDKNGNRIDDTIDQWIHQAYITLANSAATDEAKSQAKARLAGRAEVMILFNRQIASEEWGTFVALGGQVEGVFEAGAYAWSGSIAWEQIPALAIFLGPELLLIKTSPKSQIRPRSAATIRLHVGRPVEQPQR